jgi:hypothetical protein
MPGQTIEIVARQFCHVILLTVALESQHGPPQCFAPLYLADTWDNKAAPPGEMIGPWLVNRASLPLRDKDGGTIELSLTDGCQRPGGDRSSMPTRQCDPLVNIAHYREFGGIVAIRCSGKSL